MTERPDEGRLLALNGDIKFDAINVRYWAKNGHPREECLLPLVTQSRLAHLITHGRALALTQAFGRIEWHLNR
jgi:hypothetical protein